MSNKLLQVHFAFSGPFGDEMSTQLAELAQSINPEPGFIWKIWTENRATQEAGGIYLFEDEQSAQAYAKKNTPHACGNFGVQEMFYKIFRRQFTTQPD